MIESLLLVLAAALAAALVLSVVHTGRARRSLWEARAAEAELRRGAEAELHRLQRRAALVEATLGALDDAVIHIGPDRRIAYLNPAAERLAIMEPGRPLIETIRDHDLDNLLRRALAEQREQEETIQLTRPQRVIAALARPVGELGAVMILRDRTEMDHLRRVRRELVANISHELRTPLATLQLLVETLQEGAAEDPEARDHFLQQLHEQVSHLSSTVQQSLELATLESGQIELWLEPVSPYALASRCSERLLPRAQQGGVELRVRLPDELPPVRADFDQVCRVITNLLDNAIKWTPPGGIVTVSAAREGSYVRIEIADTGPGIPAEVLPRLFERFYKGDEARTGKGTGLGLAIAKHTVLTHGGRIWAESSEGDGARFHFTLPLARPPAPQESRPTADRGVATPRT
jgi:two-component system phosphate regulon sensor histidine kinase PhoR